MSTNPSISVVICCHNSAALLPPTLAHLAAQVADPSLAWDVLVVDNASSDDTAEVARRSWPEPPPAPLRVVREPRLGLMHARERGIADSSGDIVAFVDDDNWVSPGWVQAIHDLMLAHPAIGALGSVVEPEFETGRPAWFGQVANLYAIGPEGAASGDVTGTHMLCGAGLCVRRAALADIRKKGFRAVGVGRSGSGVGAGEDLEITYALRLAGWRLWIDPRLRVRHFLPARRLSWSYARRLAFGSAFATPERDALVYACKPPRTGITRRLRVLRERWLWQTAAAAARLLPAWRGLVRRRRSADGDPEVLRAEFALGRLGGLVAMRRSYDDRAREIRQVMTNMDRSRG